jgi:hypothetical protein
LPVWRTDRIQGFEKNDIDLEGGSGSELLKKTRGSTTKTLCIREERAETQHTQTGILLLGGLLRDRQLNGMNTWDLEIGFPSKKECPQVKWHLVVNSMDGYHAVASSALNRKPRRADNGDQQVENKSKSFWHCALFPRAGSKHPGFQWRLQNPNQLRWKLEL